MATLEQVEKLRERANVTYDEAKAALDASNGDILDAMIYLERKGMVLVPEGGGYYSSDGSTTSDDDEASYADDAASNAGKSASGQTFGDLVKRFFKFCAKMIHKGNINAFEIIKGDECKGTVPITVLVLLIVFAFWITLPLIIIGLFFGLHYRFCGPDFVKGTVNNVMDKAAATAEEIKRSVMENHQ